MSLAINFEKRRKTKEVSKDEGRGGLNTVLTFITEEKSHIDRSTFQRQQKSDRGHARQGTSVAA